MDRRGRRRYEQLTSLQTGTPGSTRNGKWFNRWRIEMGPHRRLMRRIDIRLVMSQNGAVQPESALRSAATSAPATQRWQGWRTLVVHHRSFCVPETVAVPS